MYELIQAGERTYYIECPSKVGIYRTGETDVWLIDSGNDKDMTRRICKILGEQGWTLKGIVNTHSNADHVGANAALVQRTGCKIVGTGMENAITRYPMLEPSFLYGGYPMKGLCNKFLCAAESVPTGTVDRNLPEGLEAFPLPGHFFEMCGIRTGDGVAFVADSVFPRSTIERYHIFFLYDVAGFLGTLDMLEGMEAELFVPSHAEATGDIRALCDLNRRKVQEIAALLVELCGEPASFEELLKQVFDHYGLELNLNQYVLGGSTIRSYLAYLVDRGELAVEFRENRMVFTACR